MFPKSVSILEQHSRKEKTHEMENFLKPIFKMLLELRNIPQNFVSYTTYANSSFSYQT